MLTLCIHQEETGGISSDAISAASKIILTLGTLSLFINHSLNFTCIPQMMFAPDACAEVGIVLCCHDLSKWAMPRHD